MCQGPLLFRLVQGAGSAPAGMSTAIRRSTLARPMKRPVTIFLTVVVALSLTAPAAWAASYRGRDLERAIVKEFKLGHGGTGGTADCATVKGDTKWRCRIQRADKRHSTRFTVTIAGAGKWKTASFRFPGFSGRYKLDGCCLKRR